MGHFHDLAVEIVIVILLEGGLEEIVQVLQVSSALVSTNWQLINVADLFEIP